ncbi:MAG: hypothetical protein AB7P76_05670 [Candidatus Melainabacteria bacterium]
MDMPWQQKEALLRVARRIRRWQQRWMSDPLPFERGEWVDPPLNPVPVALQDIPWQAHVSAVDYLMLHRY